MNNSSPLTNKHGLLASSFNNQDGHEEEPIKLTLRQAQQLKRDLITRAITEETEYLLTTNIVRALRTAGAMTGNAPLEAKTNLPIEPTSPPLPFIKYFFRKYILTFPFLSGTNISQFMNKVETFQDELSKASLSTDSDRSDTTKRKLITLRIQKILVLLFNNSIPLNTANLITIDDSEKKIKTEKAQSDPEKNDRVRDGILELEKENAYGKPYLVDIAGVRVIESKGTFMNSTHAKFIIMLTKKEDESTIYTFKSFDDFKALLKKLNKAYPLLELPHLPAKVKETPGQTFLYRESDRLTLRSVFRRLIADPDISSLPEIYEFLTTDQDKLSEADQNDISDRKMHMLSLVEDRKKYFKYVDEKAKEHNKLWESCKAELLKEGGIDELESILRNNSNVNDLPPHLKGALDWGKLNFCSFLYTFYCTTDESASLYQSLCSMHKTIPYRTISTILKYTNPTSIVKGIIDLLLAQPFGANSLIQRILTTSLMDQARDAKKEIEAVEARIGDPAICERIKNFVYLPERRGVSSKLSEEVSNYERLCAIINDSEIGPELTSNSIIKFFASKQWMDDYISGNSPKVSVDSQGESIYHEFYFLEALHQLLVLNTRKRDAENISNLMFQGVTGDIMKDLLSIFYGPLAQVYKDANASDFVMKASDFVDDLIETIQIVNTNKLDSNLEGGRLHHFIKLVERHEQPFYEFIHSVYKNNSSGLFKNLLKWGDSLFDAIRYGVVKEKIDLQELIKTEGLESSKGLRHDLELLEGFTTRRKQRQARNLKKKLRGADQTGFDDPSLISELEELDISVNNRRDSVTDFGFGKLAMDDIRDLQEIDHLSDQEDMIQEGSKLKKSDYLALANSDPAEPMICYLKEIGLQAESPKEKFSNNNEASLQVKVDDSDVVKRINKFVQKKEKLNISQEPYPEGINTIPKLLTPFWNIIDSILIN